MASLLVPADVRGLVETDLSDTGLQLLIDAADGEITKRFGPHTTADETFEVSQWDILNGGMFPFGYPWGEVYPWGSTAWLYLTRPASSIQSVTEWIGVVETILTGQDYGLRESRRLERMPEGPNPRMGWGHRVEVVYTPLDETATRKRVELDLVKLFMAHTGSKMERDGYFQVQMYDDYQAEIEAILSTLRRTLFV